MFDFNSLITIFIFTVPIVIVVAMLFSKNVLADIILLGNFSVYSALIYIITDGADVAFTEVFVGSVISTVILLATVLLTNPNYKEFNYKNVFNLLAIVVIITLSYFFIMVILDFPMYGSSTSAAATHIASSYLEDSYSKFHIPNVVTMVLGSYRGYDTLGETLVILVSVVSVCAIFVGAMKKNDNRPK